MRLMLAGEEVRQQRMEMCTKGNFNDENLGFTLAPASHFPRHQPSSFTTVLPPKLQLNCQYMYIFGGVNQAQKIYENNVHSCRRERG